MESIIAGITRSIKNDMEYNDDSFSAVMMVKYLNRYYTTELTQIEFAKDSGPAMTRLVAIKQMIDALNYTPTY